MNSKEPLKYWLLHTQRDEGLTLLLAIDDLPPEVFTPRTTNLNNNCSPTDYYPEQHFLSEVGGSSTIKRLFLLEGARPHAPSVLASCVFFARSIIAAIKQCFSVLHPRNMKQIRRMGQQRSKTARRWRLEGKMVSALPTPKIPYQVL